LADAAAIPGRNDPDQGAATTTHGRALGRWRRPMPPIKATTRRWRTTKL